MNRWVCYKNAVVTWEIRFPALSKFDDVEQLLPFVETVVRAGSEEKIFRILETPKPYVYQASSGQTYAQFLEETASTTGIFPFFCLGYWAIPTEYGIQRTPSHICFYNKARRLVEEEVDDIGSLLERLRPRAAKKNLDHIRYVPPLMLSGLPIRAEKFQAHSNNQPYLTIELMSDIWFPYVFGWMDEFFLWGPKEHMYPNWKLALCHTPRLNRFLSAVRNAVLEAGGEWSLRKEGYLPYIHMCTETGIILDDSLIDFEIGRATED